MTRLPPPPPRRPRPPYNGPLKIIGLDDAVRNEPMNFIQEYLFRFAPSEEPTSVSFARLIRAIRMDGHDELRPWSIWLAYKKHPELKKPIETMTMKEAS